jgi:hypothetical protein
MRRAFALRAPDAPFYEIARARVARGRPWNGPAGAIVRAEASELATGSPAYWSRAATNGRT